MKKGFTLIELLAVIVIIAIIIVIAVPIVLGSIKETKKNAMESDAKIIIRQVEIKKTADEKFNPLLVNKDNFEQQLGFKSDNYESISFKMVEEKVFVTLVGTNKWDNLTAYGTYDSISVIDSDEIDLTPPVITLNGDNPLILSVGETYNELGATALDAVDGAVSITSTVIRNSLNEIVYYIDTSTIGEYTVTYSASDTKGNSSIIIRTVNIVRSPEVPGNFSEISGVINRGDVLTLSWNGTSNWGSPNINKNYRIEVSYDDGNYNLLSNTMENTSTTFTVESTSTYLTFRFRVRAESNGGISDWVYSNICNINFWVIQTVGNATYYSVHNYGGRWMATGSAGTIATSLDGITWTTQSKGSYVFRTVKGVEGRWIVVGDSGKVFTSTNGTDWTVVSAGTYSYNDIEYDNGRWMIVGSSGAIATSTTGTSLSVQQVGSGIYYDVHNYNGTWVAVGNSGKIVTSTNGTNWAYDTFGSATYNSVNNYNGRWVVVGTSGTMATSTNATTWTTKTVGTNTYQSVYVYNGRWVAVGDSGRISTSTDGVNWTTQTIGSSTYYDVYWNGNWIIIGSSGVILTSEDGINWTTETVGTSNHQSVYKYNNTLVTVGDGGQIATK